MRRFDGLYVTLTSRRDRHSHPSSRVRASGLENTCVDEGACVLITGRRKSELEAAVKEIGRSVTGVQSDVSKLADIDALYAVVKKQKGKLDIVFANAGTGEFAPLGQITEEHFDKQFDVNVTTLPLSLAQRV